MKTIKVSNPKKPLNPAIDKSSFEVFCDRIAPYVILAGILIIAILLFVALVKYGAKWTGTEANLWYNQFGVYKCLFYMK